MENPNAQENVSENLYKIRHSLAHIMAEAVQELRPGTKLGFGPAISDGFYYDFILSAPLNESDFKEIETRMKKIIKQRSDFVREELPVEKAYERISEMGEPYKKEYAQELVEKNNLSTLSFYTSGDFVDMCEGPHIENTRDIPKGCFKLKSIAGAYWRADSNNEMMTRIYAWAFESKEELQKHVRAYEEALKRDHKKLGKELDLFVLDDSVGKGLPLWTPNGTVIRDEIEKLMREFEFKAGYKRVTTPQIIKSDVYYQTGHLPYYAEGMFPPMEFKEEDGTTDSYSLRPMNCPHHHKIFSSRPRSYKELPLRLAEFGQCYRYEDSGAVSGLLRVRGFCQNDAHIYCTEEQIQEEFLGVMKMHQELYDLLGFKDYYMRFSTWDPEDPKGKEKFVDDPENWEKTQALVKKAMDASGLPYVIGKGEAAFYGPKIDFQFRTVTGREETASTNQLDFGVPKRMGLVYTGADNEEHMPYIIHRAPAGSHERFAAFLIEHFGGAFPTWLAPTQVMVLTVSDAFNDYASKIIDELRNDFIRAEGDFSKDSFNKKIRNNTKKKIPNVLIIGENEVKNESVTLRRYGVEEQKTLPFQEFQVWLKEQIKHRKLN